MTKMKPLEIPKDMQEDLMQEGDCEGEEEEVEEEPKKEKPFNRIYLKTGLFSLELESSDTPIHELMVYVRELKKSLNGGSGRRGYFG